MKLSNLTQIISYKDIRNGLLGSLVVVGGITVAILTVWANRRGDFRLAGILAMISLGFVLLILIFVIPPLARSASSEASQLDLPFEFTTGGAIYLVLVVIVGFAAWNTGNNLIFIVLSFLTSAFIIGFAFGSLGLKKLDVKMRFPETIFAGEPTPLFVSLHNNKRIFPTYSIITEVRVKQREKSALLDEIKQIIPFKFVERFVGPPLVKHTLDYFFYLPPKKTIENRTEHIFNRRGRFIIKDFELSTGFPFGLFRHRRRLSAQEAEIIVYPNIEPIKAEVLHLPLEMGNRVLAKKGMGQDLLTIREYQPHDDLRHVDWKATARAQRMIVRDFAAEDERRVTVIFDTRMQKSAEELSKTLRQRIEEERNGELNIATTKRFDQGVTQVASLLAYFNCEQAEIRLVIDEQIGEFGLGKTHFHDCLKRLALVEPTFFEDDAGDFPIQTQEEVLTVRENSYSFFVTTLRENRLPAVLSGNTKILKY